MAALGTVIHLSSLLPAPVSQVLSSHCGYLGVVLEAIFFFSAIINESLKKAHISLHLGLILNCVRAVSSVRDFMQHPEALCLYLLPSLPKQPLESVTDLVLPFHTVASFLLSAQTDILIIAFTSLIHFQYFPNIFFAGLKEQINVTDVRTRHKNIPL